MNNSEGIIKFNCQLIEDEVPDFDIVKKLITIRDKLYKLKLIGIDENGIAFGNISSRIGDSNQFIITGSGTSSKIEITAKELSLVTSFSIEANSLICLGKIKASSESLTHAAAYSANSEIRSVIHIHSSELWKELGTKFVTTPRRFDYGTVELAGKIKQICTKSYKNIIVLGGHPDGIIITHRNLISAFNFILLEIMEDFK